eukprot:TRINITY_DN104218_c0_g1_i1.p1 TRINITY_DN104218_c0_g1~~TRINITY_DN104218_c0_g1_i1.p1  ORF type:complete len:127 (-),score=26.26 TRINITY_DN104218_c0_g1_i1:131-511(-)
MAPKDHIRKLGEDGFDLDEFKALIGKEDDKRLHVVDIYTTWCGPCQSIVPTLKKLQVDIDQFEDRCSVSQVDRSMMPEYAERFPETSKPRFLFYRMGAEVCEIEGLKAPEILKTIEENLPVIEVEE